jgi:ABC-type lipoprotein release transport system permease subunit
VFRNRDRMVKIFVWIVVLAMVLGVAATIGTALL